MRGRAGAALVSYEAGMTTNRIDRRRTPDVPRPEHGQRRGDKRAAKAMAEASGPGWLQRALPLWAGAAVIGTLIGVVWLG